MYQSKSVVVVTFLARHGTNLKRKEERRSWRPRTTKSENRWDDIWNATTEKKQNGRNDRGTDPTCCVEKTATQEPLLRMARATLGPDTGGWTDGGTDRPTERRAPRKHSTSADVHWVPDFRAPLPPRFASSDDFPSTGSAMMTTTTTTQVPGTRRRRRLDRPTSPLCIGRELQWSGRVQDNRRQHHLETKHVDAFRHFSSP